MWVAMRGVKWVDYSAEQTDFWMVKVLVMTTVEQSAFCMVACLAEKKVERLVQKKAI
jgi:hypothetical protein